MAQEVTYPDVTVQLTGQDGNAFVLIGIVRTAIRKAHGQEAADTFAHEAMSCKSYAELLGYLQDTVHVQ